MHIKRLSGVTFPPYGFSIHNDNEELLNDWNKFVCTESPRYKNVAFFMIDYIKIVIEVKSEYNVKNENYGLTLTAQIWNELITLFVIFLHKMCFFKMKIRIFK